MSMNSNLIKHSKIRPKYFNRRYNKLNFFIKYKFFLSHQSSVSKFYLKYFYNGIYKKNKDLLRKILYELSNLSLKDISYNKYFLNYKFFFSKKFLKIPVSKGMGFKSLNLKVYILKKVSKKYKIKYTRLLKQKRKKKHKKNYSSIFKMRHFNVLKYFYYRKYKKILLKRFIKKNRSKLFLYKRKTYINKVLRKYFLMRYLFNSYDLPNNYKKQLNYITFFKKKLYYKRSKTFLKFLILNKQEKRSFINSYYKLNNRIISLLSYYGYVNPRLPLKLKQVYVNGLPITYRNFELKGGDILYFNKISKSGDLNENLHNLKMIQSKKKNLNHFISKNYLSFMPDNNVILFDNFFYLKILNFKKDLLNLNAYRYISNYSNFYLKIFKKNLYFSKRNIKKFRELELHKNKYFKLKYLFKNNKLEYKHYLKILNMFKYATRYKKKIVTTKTKFYRQLTIMRMLKQRKTVLNSIAALYRYLHSFNKKHKK